jgi:phosphoenolpyruvate carboxykinase (GTP)
VWSAANGKAAHPNARFTAPAKQCPTISPRLDDPLGVPISAIIFGGRRARVTPLVFQTRNWQHGVFVGATMGSETTAAATGAVGVLRRDPMAMLPFCGYNAADYLGHWLAMGRRLTHPPAIFNVNWFRTDTEGKFLWPGFGENLRVLLWIIQRCQNTGAAADTPIGLVPPPNAIQLGGVNLADGAMNELLNLDRTGWINEVAEQQKFFEQFGDRLPNELSEERSDLAARLSRSVG